LKEDWGRDMFYGNDMILTLPDDDDYMFDGPSAGLAAYCAVIGAMKGWESNPKVAMTGELSPNGEVLKIGSFREKIRMADQMEMDTVFLPKDNMDFMRKYEPELEDELMSEWEKMRLTIIGLGMADQINKFSPQEEGDE
jgi:ATP-dependent Lon protease